MRAVGTLFGERPVLKLMDAAVDPGFRTPERGESDRVRAGPTQASSGCRSSCSRPTAKRTSAFPRAAQPSTESIARGTQGESTEQEVWPAGDPPGLSLPRWRALLG